MASLGHNVLKLKIILEDHFIILCINHWLTVTWYYKQPLSHTIECGRFWSWTAAEKNFWTPWTELDTKCWKYASHYLSLCWPRSMSPCGVISPQWVLKWPPPKNLMGQPPRNDLALPFLAKKARLCVRVLVCTFGWRRNSTALEIWKITGRTRQHSTQSVGNMPPPSPRHLLPHILQIMPRNAKYDQFQPKGHHNMENSQSTTKMPGNPKFYPFH